jgi:Tol biopolymer transport system component
MPRRHSLSPDGRWLAYVSTEAGASPEIYVIPFPSGQGKWQVSQGGNADSPVWSSDGKELFYAAGNSLMSVAVSQTGGDIHFGPPQKLFDNPNAQNPIVNVAPGSKKFLVARVIQQTNQPITIISNWPAELKK